MTNDNVGGHGRIESENGGLRGETTKTDETIGAVAVLADPPRLWTRRVFGPSAVFTAMAIGSGELVFWPGLSLSNAAGVLWIAILVVLLQYLMNIEIGRYSLATGESTVVGATRLWKGWAWVLLVGAVVPWLWPGWARAGCQLVGNVFNLPERPLSVASLIVCGVLLAVPARVYALVERLQAALLVGIFAGVVGLCALAVAAGGGTGGFWTALVSGAGIGGLFKATLQAQSSAFMTLLGGIVFAGAGGILNLGYGLLLCEKGFGMGQYAQPILGLRHSLGLGRAESAVPPLGRDAETSTKWRRWLSLCRREHALLFLGGNVFTIVFIALTFYSLLGPGYSKSGMGFLIAATERFGEVGGIVAKLAFTATAFAIFFTSEIGIIDTTSRIAAGILHTTSPLRRVSASLLYHAVVWFEVVVGIALIAVDPRQPFWFLVTSGVLNTIVMAIYAVLVAVLNRNALPVLARPSAASTAVLYAAAVLYGGLFVLTLARL